MQNYLQEGQTKPVSYPGNIHSKLKQLHLSQQCVQPNQRKKPRTKTFHKKANPSLCHINSRKHFQQTQVTSPVSTLCQAHSKEDIEHKNCSQETLAATYSKMTDKKLHRKTQKSSQKIHTAGFKAKPGQNEPNTSNLLACFTLENKDTCNQNEKHNFVSGHR